MRCIEIKFNGPIETQQDWLTLTWDVLKFRWSHRQSTWNEININMRCIEISTALLYLSLP